MCLILFAYKVHPVYKLVVAANRDEYFRRPTASANYWEDSPEILAGRDLEKMGTWMGVNTKGRFCALTNFRNPKETNEGKASRGELVKNALKFQGKLKNYMENLAKHNNMYPGYNLLAGTTDELFYYSNVQKELHLVKPGIYGVSNHLLNTPWPKVQIGKAGMTTILNENSENMTEAFFSLLLNSDEAPDELLPNTGIPLEAERRLSPIYIRNNDYGTRSSTVLFVSDQKIEFYERIYSNEHKIEKNRQFVMKL